MMRSNSVPGSVSNRPDQRSEFPSHGGDVDRRQEDRGQGQALVEFALVVVLLFLLLFGIIDFSRLFFAYATMSNGVREGARYGIVHHGDDAGIEQQARAMMVLIGGDATIQIIYPDAGSGIDPYCVHRCRIQVIARSNFPVWTPLIPNVRIEATATMHFE
jgi:hypothetical protein